jgi:hypothetical protein
MKKVMAIALLFWLVGVGFANAQTTILTGKLLNFDRTGPFIITSVEEKEKADGSRVFKTKTLRIGGGDSHFDITLDDATGSPLSIDIYGYTLIPPEPEPSVKHIISCLGEDFVSISSKPAGDSYPMKMEFKAIALCAFNPNGVGELTDGRAYLVMNGTTTDIAQNTTEKIVASGTLAGGFNQEGNNFVFKGPYGTVLKAPLE